MLNQTYYEPEPGLKVPEIPENPTKEQLQAAINLFIEPLCDSHLKMTLQKLMHWQF